MFQSDDYLTILKISFESQVRQLFNKILDGSVKLTTDKNIHVNDSDIYQAFGTNLKTDWDKKKMKETSMFQHRFHFGLKCKFIKITE